MSNVQVVDKPRCYIGVDPGARGGVASIVITTSTEGKYQERATAVPLTFTEKDRWRILADLQEKYKCFAVIEHIQAGGFPGTGKSQMTKLYGSYRELRAYLVACGIPHQSTQAKQIHSSLGISPRKKAKEKGKRLNDKGILVDVITGGESDTDWKNRLKAAAQRLFPRLKITLAVADALLIAEFCKRMKEGSLVK